MDLGRALRAAAGADPAAIPDVLLSLVNALGGSDVVVYLVDFAQTTLEPLPDRSTHAELARSEPVATSMAGRAFVNRKKIKVEVPGPAVKGAVRMRMDRRRIREPRRGSLL